MLIVKPYVRILIMVWKYKIIKNSWNHLHFVLKFASFLLACCNFSINLCEEDTTFWCTLNHIIYLSFWTFLFNPLPDGPRSNRPEGFQRHTAQSIKELKIWKLAISFQSQNPCHNKSTQHMAPQRSDLAFREGVWLIEFCHKQGFQRNIF
jgi:hypothetical protein